MKRLSLTLLVVVLLTAVAVYAQEVTCPIDDSGAYFTGKTRTDVSGKLLWQYKCFVYGHLFWVVR